MTDYRQAAARLRELTKQAIWSSRSKMMDIFEQSADALDHAAADRERLEQVAGWLDEIIAKSLPQPPGGQHVVATQRYQMTPSTRKELQRVRAILGDPHE